jgi:hypothetical protein
MKSILTIAALGGAIYGFLDFRKFLKAKRIARWRQKRLEIWEGEGGAVPLAATKIAAQISPKSPKKSSGASGTSVTR